MPRQLSSSSSNTSSRQLSLQATGPPRTRLLLPEPPLEGQAGSHRGRRRRGEAVPGGDTRPVDPRKKQRVPAEPQAAGLGVTSLSVEDEEMPDAGAEGRPTLKRKPAGGPGREPPSSRQATPRQRSALCACSLPPALSRG